MSERSKAAQPLSPWWRHGTLLVMIFGFSVLTVVTVLTYTNAPPVPRQIVDPAGRVFYTGAEIEQGQGVFLKHALMEHGTLWGHGAYLGPDYTAEHLHREVGILREVLAESRFGKAFADLSAGNQAEVAGVVRTELKVNRYEEPNGTLRLTLGELAASRTLERYWAEYFSKENFAPGLAAKSIDDPREIRALNAYFAWATWATVTNRPGKDYTYTNNWPYDPDAGNHPSTAAYVWSALSLVSLLGGLGLILLIFGRFHFLGWEGEGDDPEPPPGPRRARADSEPKGHRQVLRRGGGPLPASGRRRGSACPLPGRAVLVLRLRRDRPAGALQPPSHLPPPARHLLDRHGLGGRRTVPRSARCGWRSSRAALAGGRSFLGAGRRGGRKPDRRVPGGDRAPRRALVLVRASGVGVPRPRPLLAAAVDRRPAPLALPDVPRPPAGNPEGRHPGPLAPCSSTPPPRSRSSICPPSSTVPTPTSR